MNRDEDSTDILWIIALCFAAAPGVGTLAVYLVNVISLDKMLRYLSLCPLPIGLFGFWRMISSFRNGDAKQIKDGAIKVVVPMLIASVLATLRIALFV